MNRGGNLCNSLEVSISLSAVVDGVPVELNTSYTLSSTNGQLGNSVSQIPVGVSPAPIGPVSPGQLAFLYVNNLDETNQLYLSQHGDGSSPFAEVLAGAAALIPLPVGQQVYFRADSQPIAASVLALSS